MKKAEKQKGTTTRKIEKIKFLTSKKVEIMTLSRNFRKVTQQFGKVMVIAIVAIFIVGAANAQSKQKVAVYVTGDADNGTKKVIGAKLVSAITRDDGYAAVERTADFLAELGKEQNYQLSGAVADNQIVALGRQFGVRFVCVADISSVYGATFVSARMINVETAVVTATADRDKEINGMADLTELAEDVADGLLNNVAPCNKKGKPADKKGCCAGLVAIDGICSDLSEYVKIKCGLEIMLKKSNDEKCPDGWHIPTKDNLISLSKIQEALSTIIPIRTYKTSSTYDDTYAHYVINVGSTTAGFAGFYTVDLRTGKEEKVCTYAAPASSHVKCGKSELPYPPFWVR